MNPGRVRVVLRRVKGAPTKPKMSGFYIPSKHGAVLQVVSNKVHRLNKQDHHKQIYGRIFTDNTDSM